MNPHERLVDRALSGVAADLELAELANFLANPSTAKAFVAEVQERAALIQALRHADAGSAVRRVVRRRPPPRPVWWRMPVALAASMAACLVATWMLWPQAPAAIPVPEPIALVTPVEIGGVFSAATGQTLLVPVVAGGRCALRGPARLDWRRVGDDDVLSLEAGALDCDVPPRQRGTLRIRTTQAEVTVVGTAFSVTCEPSATRIAVTRGTVLVRSGTMNRPVTTGESVLADGTTVRQPELPSLVAYWPLDEGRGTIAQDRSGQGHAAQLVGNAGWERQAGHMALRLKGDDGHVLIPATGRLRNVDRGSFTLSAWYLSAVAPGAAEPDRATDAWGHAILVRRGYVEGLCHQPWSGFTFLALVNADKQAIGSGSMVPESASTWVHCAGSWAADTGTIAWWVNGQLVEQVVRGPQALFDYDDSPWRIGAAGDAGDDYRWPTNGWVREVRIHASVLTKDEVSAVAAQGRE